MASEMHYASPSNFQEIKKHSGHLFKLKALSKYLQLLSWTRTEVIKLSVATAIFFIFFFGSSITLTTGILLFPLSLSAKLWILFSIGAAFTLLSLIVLFTLYSESYWVKASGAEEVIESVKKDD
ncbi:MAG: hypothetical protein JWQ35_1223 [Bacteriovoracaceae bacterium]|nr:hypothetical protein [Bacteriovoracaceae bacterium]